MSRQSASRYVRLAFCCLALGITACSNTTRRGVTYEQRRKEIKRVAIIPASLEVRTIHADGSLEPRPDLVGPVMDNALRSLSEELSRRGITPVALKGPILPPAGPGEPPPTLAALHAVQREILDKHYVQGDESILDYSVGDLCAPTADSHDADAILWFYLSGEVPTTARKAVKATTIVTGVLTARVMYVHADRAVIVLMLVDGKSGDVLWFNRYAGTEDIEEADDLHDLIEDACRDLPWR